MWVGKNVHILLFVYDKYDAMIGNKQNNNNNIMENVNVCIINQNAFTYLSP